MPFKPKQLQWGMVFLLMATHIGCTTAMPSYLSQARPAIITGDGACHDVIVGAVRKIIGTGTIRLSLNVFRADSTMLLSNHVPAELIRKGSQPFSEAADKRFLLHREGSACLLSLVDADHRLTATERLHGCECATNP